jgi:hypothetical protein
MSPTNSPIKGKFGSFSGAAVKAGPFPFPSAAHIAAVGAIKMAELRTSELMVRSMGILCCEMEFASDFNLSSSEFGWDQPFAAISMAELSRFEARF